MTDQEKIESLSEQIVQLRMWKENAIIQINSMNRDNFKLNIEMNKWKDEAERLRRTVESVQEGRLVSFGRGGATL